MKTGAQRQKEYRARNSTSTLHVHVDPNVKAALAQLAAYYGITKKDMLLRLITEAARKLESE